MGNKKKGGMRDKKLSREKERDIMNQRERKRERLERKNDNKKIEKDRQIDREIVIKR